LKHRYNLIFLDKLY